MFSNRVRIGGQLAFDFLDEYKFQIEVNKNREEALRKQLKRLQAKVKNDKEKEFLTKKEGKFLWKRKILRR